MLLLLLACIADWCTGVSITVSSDWPAGDRLVHLLLLLLLLVLMLLLLMLLMVLKVLLGENIADFGGPRRLPTACG